MMKHFNVNMYWEAVLRQDENALRSFFCPDAWVKWHNTNEQFAVDEFVKANCIYPGDWDGEIEKTWHIGDQIVTAVHVYPKDQSCSFHVTSFIQLQEGKIAAIDEYWGDDGEPPQWRKKLKIGRKIR